MASCNYKKPFLFSAIQSSISAVGMYRIVFGLLLLMRIKKTIQMKTKLLLLLSLFVLKSNAQQCWDKISSGAYHTIAISNDGTLWAWGYNDSGQLGDGTYVNKTVPTKIGTDTDWVSISTGYYHSFAIKSNGTLWG